MKGRHTDTISLANSKRWCMTAYNVFAELSKTESSVRMRTANFFFDKKIEAMADQLCKMKEIEHSEIQLFHRDPELIGRHAVNQNAGVIDSYAYLAPVIDTDAYMVCYLFSASIVFKSMVTGLTLLPRSG